MTFIACVHFVCTVLLELYLYLQFIVVVDKFHVLFNPSSSARVFLKSYLLMELKNVK